MGIVSFFRRKRDTLLEWPRSIITKYREKLYYYVLDCDFSLFQPLQRAMYTFLTRNKRIIGFYGECHITIYSNYLKSSPILMDRYRLVFAEDINRIARRIPQILGKKRIWNKCDFLIYNFNFPINDGVPRLSLVESWLPDSCKKVSVTNVVFDGYFPQHTNRVFSNDKYFIWGDKNLNRILESGSFDEVYSLFDDNYYSKDDVVRFYERALKRLKMIEKDCCIRIADYVERHGKERVLFYSTTHPESEIMVELTRRILIELGERNDEMQIDYDSLSSLYNLQCHGEIVYPSVYLHLGLPGSYKDRIITPGKHMECHYDFEQYVDEYLQMGQGSEGL